MLFLSSIFVRCPTCPTCPGISSAPPPPVRLRLVSFHLHAIVFFPHRTREVSFSALPFWLTVGLRFAQASSKAHRFKRVRDEKSWTCIAKLGAGWSPWHGKDRKMIGRSESVRLNESDLWPITFGRRRRA